MSEPSPPKANCDDILAALYSLMAAVEALEEWHRADVPVEAAASDDEIADEQAQVA